jgi:hypothetical protein
MARTLGSRISTRTYCPFFVMLAVLVEGCERLFAVVDKSPAAAAAAVCMLSAVCAAAACPLHRPQVGAALTDAAAWHQEHAAGACEAQLRI